MTCGVAIALVDSVGDHRVSLGPVSKLDQRMVTGFERRHQVVYDLRIAQDRIGRRRRQVEMQMLGAELLEVHQVDEVSDRARRAGGVRAVGPEQVPNARLIGAGLQWKRRVALIAVEESLAREAETETLTALQVSVGDGPEDQRRWLGDRCRNRAVEGPTHVHREMRLVIAEDIRYVLEAVAANAVVELLAVLEREPVDVAVVVDGERGHRTSWRGQTVPLTHNEQIA
jgi:hypothetical protein